MTSSMYPSYSLSEHAQITLTAIAGSQTVLKRLGVGRGLTEAEAGDLMEEHRVYHQNLTELGIPVPSNPIWEVVHVLGEWQLWFSEDWIPGSTGSEMLFEYGWDAFPRLLNTAVELVTKISSPRGSLRCGIDLKPSNLVLTPTRCYLVDSFPPLNLSAGKVNDICYNPKIHRFSREKLEYVCCTPIGMVSRFVKLVLIQLDNPPIDAYTWPPVPDYYRTLSRDIHELACQDFPNLRIYY